MTDRPVSLRKITDANRSVVSALHVGPGQDGFVATVEKSFRDAAETPEAKPRCRAIYAGDEPVGFVMLGSEVPDQPNGPVRWFLWRLLVDEHHQHLGYGRETLRQIIEMIRADGATELYTSYVPGDRGPWPFYEKLGFVPTGEMDEDEIVIRLAL